MIPSNPFRSGATLVALLVLSCASLSLATPDCVETTGQAIFDVGTNGVSSIYAADLDDDGDTDIVSASANDDSIIWYENNGADPPSYTSHVITTAANGASAVFAEDINADGMIDVLSASANDDTIAWYENDGETPPRFIERVILTNADNASDVYAADIDDDGDMDIISASIDDNKIAICLNDGNNPTPGFSEAIVTTGALGASSVVAADIDQDGIDDVISASRFDDTIAWYTFPGPLLCDDIETDCTVDEDCVECPVDDPDCADEDKEPIGSGSCTTRPVTHEISASADGASSVFAIDMDGDMDIDVVSASSNDDEIAWYENAGPENDFAFEKRIISTSADGANAVFAVDLNGDGDVDVLSASRFDDKIAWYENDGNENFTEKVVTVDAPGANSVFAGAIDEGATVDVLASSSIPGPVASNDKIAWHENDGGMDPVFAERLIGTSSPSPEAIVPALVDGDGHLDVVAASSSDSKVAWYRNDGEDPPAFVEQIISFAGGRPTSLAWGDVNGDGFDDVVLATSGDADRIVWFENDGEDPPGFTEHLISMNLEGASSVFLANLDGDMDLDVLSASTDDDKIAWYENDGMLEPSFTQRTISNNADSARSVFAVDFDLDLDIDVLSASSGDDKVAWYENDGGMPPTFVEHVISADPDGPGGVEGLSNGAWSVFAVDFDQDEDADVDVLVASANNDTIAWWENVGFLCTDFVTECESNKDCAALELEDDTCDRRFGIRLITTFADFARQVIAVDLDGDLDLDAMSASSGDDTVAWYENIGLLCDDRETVCSVADDCADAGGGLCQIRFTEHVVSTSAEDVRATAAGDVNGDGALDVLTGFSFELGWHRGDADEICGDFDGNADGRIDGVEIVWLGMAFADSCVDPETPEAEWWFAIDANRDCLVDGEDLAILSSTGVWAQTTETCTFTCQ